MAFFEDRRVARTLGAIALLAGLVLLGCAPDIAWAKDDAPATSSPLSKEEQNRIEKQFKSTLSDKDPAVRARAFELLRPMAGPRAIELLLGGVKRVAGQRQKLVKLQRSCEEKYENCIDKLQSLQEQFDMSTKSGHDIDRFNKKSKKVGKQQETILKTLKDLENQYAQNDALMQSATLVTTAMLRTLDGDALIQSLTQIENAWLLSKKPPDRVRWLHAVWDVRKPEVDERLVAVYDNSETPPSIRRLALRVLAAHGDGRTFPRAIATLKLPPDQSNLTLDGIEALARMHDKRCIMPLITFLGREDIARLREDAQRALTSLTGLKHGPYPGPWKTWWDEHGEQFILPKNPVPHTVSDQSKKGGTFYGIPTFSDRVLYIIDISGSMDRVPRKEAAKRQTKMDVAKRELMGAIHGLNPTDQFGVIFFNHSVIPWQSKAKTASEGTKKVIQGWVTKQKPVGGTNIHDALEAGFRFASTVTGRPVVDTIFFLTDGRPTAGRLLDSKRILDAVREWNDSLKLRIHAVGIGEDHDADFMRELAQIGGGEYRVRKN